MSDKHPKCGNCGKLIYDYYLRWSDQDGVRTHFHESDGECVENLKAQLEAVRQKVEDAEDGGWCFECNEYIGITSHYHCANCGQVCSMMGHREQGKYTCQARQSPPPSEGRD